MASKSKKNKKLITKNNDRDIPPPGVISHVTVRVRNIERSLNFYEKFGLEACSPSVVGVYQFLRPSKPSKKSVWQTLICLQEDESIPPRGESYEAGMTRLCIYTFNLDADVKRLSSLGLEPIAPVAEGRKGGRIAAYSDPDNFIVYLIQFKKFIGFIFPLIFKFDKKANPIMFHWTVNVTDAKAGMTVFEVLGFTTLSTKKKEKVLYDLLPAFGIEPKGALIEFIRYCRLPKDKFVVTIMKWLKPKSKMKGSELLNSITIAVQDVEQELQCAREAGLQTEPIVRRTLPLFGEVLIGSLFVEPGCNRVELCCFDNKHINKLDSTE